MWNYITNTLKVEPSAEEKLEDMRLLLEKQAETFQAIIVEQDRRVNEIYLSYLKVRGLLIKRFLIKNE